MEVLQIKHVNYPLSKANGIAATEFQYIFAKYYELSHPRKIMYMDNTFFMLHHTHNGYVLEKVLEFIRI